MINALYVGFMLYRSIRNQNNFWAIGKFGSGIEGHVRNEEMQETKT